MFPNYYCNFFKMYKNTINTTFDINIGFVTFYEQMKEINIFKFQ